MKRCFSCFHTYEDEYTICPVCGQIEDCDPIEPIHLSPGVVLADRYILGQAVGAGGFGIVYKAWDSKLETIVAIKEFFASKIVTRAEGLKNLIVAKKSQEEFEYRKKRFLAEARTMAKFGSHKNIPNVFEFFEENNTAYIVMEMLNGVALNDYLHSLNDKIDTDFAIMVANEVGNALKSLHAQNIIHRDVAPDNIFICAEKEIKVKLMDFGAAKLSDSTDDVIDIILKPGYSPPEQYDKSNNIGRWSDVYALGATLYYMLTGVKPDESTNRKIQDEVLPPNEINSDISENLSNAIMKAMAVESHMRFHNIQDFLEAINGERKVKTLSKERKQKKMKRFIGVAAACLVISIVGAFGYKIFSDKKAEGTLEAATITVWFSVSEEESDEEKAMEAIKSDFENTFAGVTIELKAISEIDYQNEIAKAAKSGNLPTIFESTNISDDIINQAHDLDNVLSSKQFKSALFLSQYDEYYSNNKQLPLAIEVPMAFVITNGAESIDYQKKFFTSIDDFKYDRIAVDEDCTNLVLENFNGYKSNYGIVDFLDNEDNNSAVLLSSTMKINAVRANLTSYKKEFVYPDSNIIYCNFTYEWSLGGGDDAQIAAGERLLTWMLGNSYQNYLMISECSDGQIPVNSVCFNSKIKSQYLSPIEQIYNNFVFKRGGNLYG